MSVEYPVALAWDVFLRTQTLAHTSHVYLRRLSVIPPWTRIPCYFLISNTFLSPSPLSDPQTHAALSAHRVLPGVPGEGLKSGVSGKKLKLQFEDLGLLHTTRQHSFSTPEWSILTSLGKCRISKARSSHVMFC